MPLIALIAVLLAAATHATWNLSAKRAAGSRHFVWMYSVASMALYSGWAVKVLLVSPFIVDYTGNLFRVIVLSPMAWRDRRRKCGNSPSLSPS